MTIPVIHSLAAQNRQLRITVLTRDNFTPMFEWMPANVNVIGVNLANYKGIGGLTQLFHELSKYQFDAVADIHDVLRTKFLRMCFRLTGVKVRVIDKGRSDKHALIGNAQKNEALKHTTERYADVFRKLLNIDFNTGNKANGQHWIGIAPFAAHMQKVYPLNLMRLTAELLAEKGYHVFLFGAGKEEAQELRSWECDGIKSVCGKLGGLHDELLLMTQLDLMISMDSANMHMAAMVGTKTLSIWGATHPKAGFTAFAQGDENIIQLDLPCRPCSIYGNKPCKFGDLRCMNGIKPADIVSRVTEILNK